MIDPEIAAQHGIRINVAQGIIFDTSGNFGIIDTFSGGVGGFGLSSGWFFGIIDAPTIHAVQGLSVELGAALAPTIAPIPVFPILDISIYFGVEWTISLGGVNNYHGRIYSYGTEIGYTADINPYGSHYQLSFSNISSTPKELLIRLIFGPQIAHMVSLIENCKCH